MKKLLVMLFAVILTCISFTGCKSKDALIVGFDPHFPPMGFFENESETDASKAVGFDVDLAKAVGEILNVEIKFKSITWSNKENELASKNIDLIWNGYTITDERSKNHLFSAAYMKNDQVMVINATDKETYKSFEDLKAQKVIVQKGSSAEDLLKAKEGFNQSIMMPVDDYADAILELKANAKYIVMDSVVANYMASKDTSIFVIENEVLGTEQYGIGIRNKDSGEINKDEITLKMLKDNGSLLKEKIDEALKTLQDNGKLEEIAANWGLENNIIDIK